MANDPGTNADPGTSEPSGITARLVRLVLGVYLLPVVLVVLVVAALGLIALGAGRLAVRASRSVIPAHHLRTAARRAHLTN